MEDRPLGIPRTRLAAILARRTTWAAVAAACVTAIIGAYVTGRSRRREARAVGEVRIVEDRPLGISRTRLAAILARRTTWLAVSVVSIAIMVGAYVTVIPVAADRVARRVPVGWERQLGETVTRALVGGGPRCSHAESLAAVRDITTRLLHDAPPHPYDIRVSIVHSNVENAFAAPGGGIVVYTGLLRRMDSPEQLAAVLAHELQHTLERHGTRTLFQQSAVAVLASLLVGDMGGTMAVVMDAASTMGALAYSRHYEKEADAKAADMLLAADVDIAGLAEFFRSMEAIQPDAPGVLTYFSTHPATSGRVAAAEAMQRDSHASVRPVMSPERWEALQAHIGGRGRS